MTGQALTIAGLFRPRTRQSALIYDAVMILTGSVIIAISAQLAVLMPYSPILVTGQTFAVLMLGALLGARRAGLCILAYIIEGVAGLPVFMGGGCGIVWLIGPTGGYLVGFVVAATLVGYLAERGWDKKVWTTVAAMMVGNICIYAFGAAWLGVLGVENKFETGVYPFIAGDIVKTVLAAILLPAGWKVLKRFSNK